MLDVDVLHLIEIASILEARSEAREGDWGREVGGEMDNRLGLHIGRQDLIKELDLDKD